MMMMMNDDKGEKTSYLLVMVYFGLIIFSPRNLVRGTSGSFTMYMTYFCIQHCLCVSYRGARVSKCMQAFSQGVRIVNIISASD